MLILLYIFNSSRNRISCKDVFAIFNNNQKGIIAKDVNKFHERLI
jgi:hypothetical protein